MVLLDLLGAEEPSIRSYFISTAWLFDGLIDIEKRLADAALSKTSRSFFLPRSGPQINYNGVGDDHVPFIHRGVSVLHVIANPFPPVWHTLRVCQSFLDHA